MHEKGLFRLMLPSCRRFILQQTRQTDGAPDKQVNGPSDQTQHEDRRERRVGRCNKGKSNDHFSGQLGERE